MAGLLPTREVKLSIDIIWMQFPLFSLTRPCECDKPVMQNQNCAHFVLKPTSLQLIPAHSSQSSGFAQTLAGVGLSESEWAGGGSWKRFPKPQVVGSIPIAGSK